MNKRVFRLIFAGILAAFFFVSCSPAVSSSSNSETQPVQSSQIDGKNLLETRCGSCHSTTRVTSKSATADEWKATVDRMIGKGAQLTSEEESILVQYLSEKYK